MEIQLELSGKGVNIKCEWHWNGELIFQGVSFSNEYLLT